MLYTSGTTGRPKGVMLTHANVVISGANANVFDQFTADDTMLAYLPMAWVGDHIFSYGQAYAGGLCVACPESPETAQEDRREIGPTYFFAPPRVFETMLTQMTVRMEDAGTLKKKMFDYFLAVARQSGEKILDGKEVPFADRVKYWLGDKLVYAPLRNRMGFSNLRLAYTAGEAIGPELFQFYRSLGMNLKQLYGQTEASVFITLQPDGEVFPETVGKPGPEVEIKIAEVRRSHVQEPGRIPQIFQERRSDCLDQDTGRLGAFRRRRLHRQRVAISSSSTVPRMSAGSTTVRFFRRSISRTASSSSLKSRKPSRSGMAATSSRCSSTST